MNTGQAGNRFTKIKQQSTLNRKIGVEKLLFNNKLYYTRNHYLK